MSTTSTPAVQTDVLITVLTPSPQIGVTGDQVGFYGTTPIVKPSVTASGVSAATLLAALAALGLVTSA